MASPSDPQRALATLVDLLDDVVASIRAYVYLRAEMKYAEAIALWIVGTHAFAWSNTFPRFVATSPEPNCGKSTLLKVMEALCPNSSYHAQATEAAIVRRISRAKEQLGVTPTMFLDDAENFINEKHTNFLNSGFDRFGGTLLRCRVSKGNFVDEEFDVYVPVAIGRIGTTPVDSTRSRCLEVNVQRARPGDHYLRLNADGRARLLLLAEQLADRIDRDGADLENYDPELPAALANRDADLWRFLIAIADLAGGHWPQTARDTASAITLRASSRSSSEEICLALQAALDLARNSQDLAEAKLSLQQLGIHEVASGNFRIPSMALCQLLSKVSDTLKSIDERSLANKLRPFDIRPASIRGSKPAKGYKEEDLRDLLDRYRPFEHPDG